AAVRPKNLLGATIPLPPLPEQRRIVARIEELAAKVEEAHGLRAQSAEEAESFGIASVAQVFAQARERLLFRDTNSCEIICGQHLSPDEQSDSGIPYTTGPADFGK